jgi:hypothetical protein
MRDGRRSLTVAQQLLWLRASDICTGSGTLTAHSLRWKFEARSNPFARIYSIRIEYGAASPPAVFVDSPNLLLLADERKLPHVYSENPTQLCLYFPPTGEWAPWMRLDQTLVPWTFLWLEYFEAWLRDGIWHGGGIHPTENAA